MNKEKVLALIANGADISEISLELDLYETEAQSKNLTMEALKKSNSELAAMITSKKDVVEEKVVEEEVVEEEIISFEDALIELI